MYKRHRFPPEIIQHTAWLYHRFNLSARDIEDLMAERGIAISYESIRLWCIKLGPKYAKRLRRRHRGYGDAFFSDEVFVRIQGKQHHLWRAVDQDGEVVDVFLQNRRDGKTAIRFFKRLLRASDGEPRRIITDKLRSYRKFKSAHQAQRFLNTHAAVYNLFNRLGETQRLCKATISGVLLGVDLNLSVISGSGRATETASVRGSRCRARRS